MRIEREKQTERLEKMRPLFPYYVSEYIQSSLDHLSPSSLVSYLVDIQDFLEWLITNGLSDKQVMKDITLAELDQLIEMDVSHYRSYLKYREDSNSIGKRYYKTKNKDVTIGRKISAMKSLFSFLHKNINRDTNVPYISRNVFENAKVRTAQSSVRARAQKLSANIIRLEEVSDFQNFILRDYGEGELSKMERSYWLLNRHRDTAIVSVLLSSGIRVGELSGLRMKDTLTASRKLVVDRKRDKEDVVFFSNQTLALLQSYMEVRETQYKATSLPNDPLFVTKYAGKVNPISKNAVQKMIIKYAKAYGKPELTAHILRHSFGTNVFKVTKNIRGVQEALGHSSMNTTQIYTHMFEDDERDMIDEVFKG